MSSAVNPSPEEQAFLDANSELKSSIIKFVEKAKAKITPSNDISVYNAEVTDANKALDVAVEKVKSTLSGLGNWRAVKSLADTVVPKIEESAKEADAGRVDVVAANNETFANKAKLPSDKRIEKISIETTAIGKLQKVVRELKQIIVIAPVKEPSSEIDEDLRKELVALDLKEQAKKAMQTLDAFISTNKIQMPGMPPQAVNGWKAYKQTEHIPIIQWYREMTNTCIVDESKAAGKPIRTINDVIGGLKKAFEDKVTQEKESIVRLLWSVGTRFAMATNQNAIAYMIAAIIAYIRDKHPHDEVLMNAVAAMSRYSVTPMSGDIMERNITVAQEFRIYTSPTTPMVTDLKIPKTFTQEEWVGLSNEEVHEGTTNLSKGGTPKPPVFPYSAMTFIPTTVTSPTLGDILDAERKVLSLYINAIIRWIKNPASITQNLRTPSDKNNANVIVEAFALTGVDPMIVSNDPAFWDGISKELASTTSSKAVKEWLDGSQTAAKLIMYADDRAPMILLPRPK